MTYTTADMAGVHHQRNDRQYIEYIEQDVDPRYLYSTFVRIGCISMDQSEDNKYREES